MLTVFIFSPATGITFTCLELKILGRQAKYTHVFVYQVRRGYKKQRHVVVESSASEVVFMNYYLRNLSFLSWVRFVVIF